MFSPENFYQYLLTRFKECVIDTEMYYFRDPGIRTLDSINIFGHRQQGMPPRYASRCFLSDQEPLDFNFYANWRVNDLTRAFGPLGAVFAKNLQPLDLVSYFFSGAHTPILCHSEKNSNDVALFKEHFFSTAHYFYHGLIARDWYRHWKYYNISKDESAMRFGLYARDAAGTRNYRISLLEKLTSIKNHVYYKLQPEIADQLHLDIRSQWTLNDVIKGPESSATIDLDDAAKFHIHLVPETLFDTHKTHLTEKIFKPIVMKQPFILIGPPRGLSYLRDYGFQTFNDIWDESYDKELNPEKRLNDIISLTKQLASMSNHKFLEMIHKTNSIIEFNHKHFYSQAFEDTLVKELHDNLDLAIAETQERFFQMPGGNWFYYQNKLIKQGYDLPETTRQLNQNLIAYIKEQNDDTTIKQIISKYGHLL